MRMNEITLRCHIRPFTREDAADVFKFTSLPEVAINANFLPHRSLSLTQENLERWIVAGDIFAIELKEEGKVFGAISFRADAASPVGWYKIGYTCHPDYQGQGYIGEALRKVMDHLFYDRDVVGIALHIFADNLPSINVAKRAGFDTLGETNRKVRFDGTDVIENIYRITNPEYRKEFGGRWFGEIRSAKHSTAEPSKIITRQAVRAIIRRGNTILLVASSGDDVKFPGGGINDQETPIEALKREVLEETGYFVTQVGRHVGYIEEITVAVEGEEHLFMMRSDYYAAEIEEIQATLKLDDYEAELGFHPVWITLDQAITANRNCAHPKRWTKRDLEILTFLKHQESAVRET
ncbi:MAG: GNAT family N-acetyltransferase [Erysipelotrichales bacterium]|nr:MAG: GNAT family N-acetyltransferase [Erysipelotrichales bacterium]